MHLGKNNPKYEYYIGPEESRIKLKVTNKEKDIGVYIDPLLKFDDHVSETVKKASRISYLILKTINCKIKCIMVPLFKTLIRPILEYGNVVWNNKSRKHANSIEKVQRSFTKYITEVKDMDYNDRLKYLNLPSLEFRRLRGDLIEIFKITNKIYDSKTTDKLFNFSSNQQGLRQHNFKIFKSHTNKKLFKNFFTNRSINIWNKLPEHVVNVKTTNSFKNTIDKHFKDIMYCTNLTFMY